MNIVSEKTCPIATIYFNYKFNLSFSVCLIQNNNKIHRSRKLYSQVQSIYIQNIDPQIPHIAGGGSSHSLSIILYGVKWRWG